MTKVTKFKKDCSGFVDRNYRDLSKPSFCGHYKEDGTCAFYHDALDNNIDCDDVDNGTN